MTVLTSPGGYSPVKPLAFLNRHWRFRATSPYLLKRDADHSSSSSSAIADSSVTTRVWDSEKSLSYAALIGLNDQRGNG